MFSFAYRLYCFIGRRLILYSNLELLSLSLFVCLFADQLFCLGQSALAHRYFYSLSIHPSFSWLLFSLFRFAAYQIGLELCAHHHCTPLPPQSS